MKKLFRVSIFLISFLLVNTAFSQNDWRWNTHGVGFSAPANLRVLTNNAEEFTAESNDLYLTIYAEQNGEVDEETLKQALIAAATEMEYDDISAADALEIDDFTGFFVEGTKDGVGAFILTLLDKKSSTNLVIVIAYTSEAARQKAIEIGDSFYAFD